MLSAHNQPIFCYLPQSEENISQNRDKCQTELSLLHNSLDLKSCEMSQILMSAISCFIPNAHEKTLLMAVVRAQERMPHSILNNDFLK